MSTTVVSLNVPARPQYARSVRMMAANLAVLSSMNVDEVEDVRMAAEEAFVLACATNPKTCAIEFAIGTGRLNMSFSLGDQSLDEAASEQVSMSRLLLSCVSDSFEFSGDGTLLLVDMVSEEAHAG